MKKLILLSLFSLLINFQNLMAQPIAVQTNPLLVETPKIVLSWDKTAHDFGEIPQGIPVETQFKLTNNSDEPLLVTDVKRTCGCTVAGYSQEPVLPGESTIITTTYNAKKEGKFNKVIKVSTSQTTEAIPLKLSGTVVNAEE